MARRSPGLRKRIGLDLFSKLYAAEVAEHELRTLFWECTLRCNLACRHCGSDCRVDPGVADMPLEDFLRVLDEEVTPHVDPRRVLVIFSGGEVLVRDDLERAGAEVARRGYPWGMVTNGLALTPERFRALRDAGLRSVSVSFDGFPEVHNYIRRNPHSYDRALDAIRLIVREEGLAYDVITCVTGAMVPRLEAFRELLLAEGVKHWRLFSIFPVGRAKNDGTLRMSDAQFRDMLEFIRRSRRLGGIEVSYACEGFLGRYETEVRDHFYQCAAGVSVASIRVDGAISGCTSIRANFHQGNIYRDRFWEVWQNRFGPFRDREWARKGSAPTAKCSATVWAAACICTTTKAICSTVITIGCSGRRRRSVRICARLRISCKAAREQGEDTGVCGIFSLFSGPYCIRFPRFCRRMFRHRRGRPQWADFLRTSFCPHALAGRAGTAGFLSVFGGSADR